MRHFLCLILISLGLIGPTSYGQIPADYKAHMGGEMLHLRGRVMGLEENGGERPLAQASVYVLPDKTGTLTDNKGYFHFPVDTRNTRLLVSFVGFQPDTLLLSDYEGLDDMETASPFLITLQPVVGMDSIVIEERSKATGIDMNSLQLIEGLNRSELLKAACCNLGESFETNASVDVNYPDAVSGTKQIQLLGLAGPYTQYTLESIPGLRGLATGIGLDFIPGPWIDNIQIAKGAGSVANGYESFSGQINVELQKPQTGKKLYLNAYANQGGRMEFNAMTTHTIGQNAGITLLGHAGSRTIINDRNQDGFADNPLSQTLNGLARFYYSNQKNLQAQLGVQYINDFRQGGQTNALRRPGGEYGIQWSTRHVRLWGKVGYVNPRNTEESLGLQLTGIFNDQERDAKNLLYAPILTYTGQQQTFYANLIYQNILWTSDHQIRMGASFLYDNYLEELLPFRPDGAFGQLGRLEQVPGVFAEYTYKYLDRWRVVAGLRGDWHNLWGFFLTPRLHVLYRPTEALSLRLSGGRGQRTANIRAETANLFLASNRVSNFQGTTILAYGFPAEVAWNMGVNVTYQTRLAYRPLQIRAEYFYTYFEQMTVVDRDVWEAWPIGFAPEISVYPLIGYADAQSFQLNLDYEPVRRAEIRLALKRQVSWISYRRGRGNNPDEVERRLRPFLPRWRAFFNASYKTRSDLAFDATVQYIGEQRLPQTQAFPAEYQSPEFSPDFITVNAQISKAWGEQWYVYIGVENLFNFMQENPIISADDIASPYFDATMIWGPIFGRMVYVGVNFQLE